MKKTSKFCLAIFLCFCFLVINITAHPAVDTEKNDCSIQMILQDNEDGNAITDAEFLCFRVGAVDDSDGNFSFRHILTGKNIENIDSADTAAVFNKEISNNIKKFESYTFSKPTGEGIYSVENLPVGLYLIIQNKSADNYGDIKPFLVSVPFLQEGKYEYEVTANIKTELYKESETAPSSKPEKLPQTGQLLWPILLLASVGLAFIVLGCYLRRDKGNKDL